MKYEKRNIVINVLYAISCTIMLAACVGLIVMRVRDGIYWQAAAWGLLGTSFAGKIANCIKECIQSYNKIEEHKKMTEQRQKVKPVPVSHKDVIFSWDYCGE